MAQRDIVPANTNRSRVIKMGWWYKLAVECADDEVGRGMNSDSRYDGARQGRAYSKYQARNACKNIETG